ncbi:MAG: hypothetical protein ACON31_05530 [Candidatus Puniceispirillaceae bacterium]
MKKRNFAVAVMLAATLCAAAPVAALTFKKGQVLGADGNVYDGASPDQEAALIKKAEDEGELAGIAGTNLYVVLEGKVTYVPLSEVRGKTKEGMKEVIAAYVLTGAEIGQFAEIEGSGFDKLTEGNLAYEIGQIADEAARQAAEEAFAEVVESLEGATIEQIEEATGSTHIGTTSCGEGCVTETFY